MPEIIVKLGDNIVQKYFFVREDMNIGRVADNEIVIENLAVSRTHATISYEDGLYMLADLGSSNGTYVNGVRVKKTAINDKDVIAIGKHKLYFYNPDPQAERRPVVNDVDSTMLMAPQAPTAEIEVNKGRQTGQTFELTTATTSIGRGNNNDIRLTDWFVSKNHAVIERRGDQFYIRDLGSWRHTMVNDAIVEESRLVDGDNIKLGGTVNLIFRCESSVADMPAPGEALAPAMDEPEVAPRNGAHPASAAELEPPADPEADTGGGIEAEGFDTITRGPRREPIELDPAGPEDAEHDPEAELAPVLEPDTAEALEMEETPQPAEAVEPEPVNLMGEAPAAEADEMPEPVEADLEPAQSGLEIEAEPMQDAGTEAVVEEAVASDDEPQTDAEPEPIEAGGEPEPGEVAMWEKALTNKSALIRKQAARRLKELTGRDYDY